MHWRHWQGPGICHWQGTAQIQVECSREAGVFECQCQCQCSSHWQAQPELTRSLPVRLPGWHCQCQAAECLPLAVPVALPRSAQAPSLPVPVPVPVPAPVQPPPATLATPAGALVFSKVQGGAGAATARPSDPVAVAALEFVREI